MPGKRHTTEQKIRILREGDRGVKIGDCVEHRLQHAVRPGLRCTSQHFVEMLKGDKDRVLCRSMTI